MGRVLIVPGLAVRTYAERPVQGLRDSGVDAELLGAPAGPGEPTDLIGYGRKLAAELSRPGPDVDLLIGLSTGCQAAAVAASEAPVGRLVLISPTVAPEQRTPLRLIRAWLTGGEGDGGPKLSTQMRDWASAGVPHIYRGFRSAIAVHLEDLLPQVSAPVTIVHGEYDTLSPYAYAAALADATGARLVIMPGAPHSWPVNDPERFVEFVKDLLATPVESR